LHSHDSFIYGGDGDDRIYLNARDLSETSNVFAEGGRDIVTAYGGTNYIDGGDGYDTLINLGGNNAAVGFETIIT